ncbi:site-specific integrase, partial [bacterium]|nr:site-specific integrase [bacterium]
ALNWEEVNLDKKRIHIRRTLTKDGKLGPPKSKKSVRFVKLTDSLAQDLRAWKAEQKQKYGSVLYVLCSLSGKARININHCRKVHAGILKKLGLRKIRLHDLRHTYATFLLQKGASVWWVSRQMGHSSIQVTIDTYFHYLPDEDARDAAFLNEFPSGSDQEND